MGARGILYVEHVSVLRAIKSSLRPLRAVDLATLKQRKDILPSTKNHILISSSYAKSRNAFDKREFKRGQIRPHEVAPVSPASAVQRRCRVKKAVNDGARRKSPLDPAIIPRQIRFGRNPNSSSSINRRVRRTDCCASAMVRGACSLLRAAYKSYSP